MLLVVVALAPVLMTMTHHEQILHDARSAVAGDVRLAMRDMLRVVQEQAAVQARGQMEPPLALRDLVKDARGQGQPALVIDAVFGAAVVGGHRAGARTPPASMSRWNLPATHPQSTTLSHAQTTTYHH